MKIVQAAIEISRRFVVGTLSFLELSERIIEPFLKFAHTGNGLGGAGQLRRSLSMPGPLELSRKTPAIGKPARGKTNGQ